jgi:hypothetical protein
MVEGTRPGLTLPQGTPPADPCNKVAHRRMQQPEHLPGEGEGRTGRPARASAHARPAGTRRRVSHALLEIRSDNGHNAFNHIVQLALAGVLRSLIQSGCKWEANDAALRI